MKKMTYVVAFFLLMSVLMVPAAGAAGKVPQIKINGTVFVTPAGEPQPYINKDYRTMGSVRLVGNALGVLDDNIEWDDQARTVTMEKNKTVIVITVGQQDLSVNGKTVTMDTVAELKNGRVFIPLRFIAESLGAEIDFDDKTRTVLITTDDPSVGKHNFASYKQLKVLENFPIVLDANGLKLTVHEAYLYKADSKEAKDLQRKYDFQEFYRAKYLVWSKVTLENNTKETVRYDGLDMNQKIEWLTGSGDVGVILLHSSSIKVDKMNGTEVLNGFVLKPGESITSWEAQIDYLSESIDLIAVAVTNKSVSPMKILAAREELL
ncbi:copper amine oxidase N-terminal domain-containing protein [Paenibacillus sp. 1011MAR3C5]|uniref:copper amine oxidase N-terminal domain-containing protein n=1 Tax=Paenibacillus sp. 1011MAR3C5 TaxID=1675787 RepID=UPI000E6D1C2E|nr:copper amine oxidase N-terminal domain-containing protein [Paenibacillus sp. 1011MAR3C5]RJE86926.1 copper amine oxidase N-terminal domain-containing protein [Paenibacillus sp. 1011MAR3C5]